MATHAFAHCDSTNAFKGIWKIKPIKTMQKKQIKKTDWEVANYVLAGFEAFTNV